MDKSFSLLFQNPRTYKCKTNRPNIDEDVIKQAISDVTRKGNMEFKKKYSAIPYK